MKGYKNILCARKANGNSLNNSNRIPSSGNPIMQELEFRVNKSNHLRYRGENSPTEIE